MTSILGISAFYHDSAAALVIDGKIVAAAQEERFSRKKHDPRYPYNAIEFVLKNSKVELNKVDHIVFFEISSDVTEGVIKFFLRVIAIQPEPVPISKTLLFSNLISLRYFS